MRTGTSIFLALFLFAFNSISLAEKINPQLPIDKIIKEVELKTGDKVMKVTPVTSSAIMRIDVISEKGFIYTVGYNSSTGSLVQLTGFKETEKDN